jgi:hypothetical protein
VTDLLHGLRSVKRRRFRPRWVVVEEAQQFLQPIRAERPSFGVSDTPPMNEAKAGAAGSGQHSRAKSIQLVGLAATSLITRACRTVL